MIDEAHLLFNCISLIEITKEFDKVALPNVINDDIKHFPCLKDFIFDNPLIGKKSNMKIYVKKQVSDFDEQTAEIIN